MSWRAHIVSPAPQNTAAALLEESHSLLSDSVVLINVLKIASLFVSQQGKLIMKSHTHLRNAICVLNVSENVDVHYKAE